ncbi:MAG: phosphatidylserine decarboxylase family protein [Bacteroidales bacterium]|nr:phosphatidylserine decarboxylase family protein [Bacteroidales bacterium]
MKIHKEGYNSIAAATIVTVALLIAIHYFFPIQTVFHYIGYLALLVCWIIVVRFFRMPFRELVEDSDIALCPADGTVVAIEEVFVDEFFNDKRLQISVFMSPNNVHVNRYPVSGKIVYTNYWPGSFLVAWHPKSSTENERNTVVVEHQKYGPIMIRQIAGALARRIVCYSKTNERIVQGKELGFIKFGSRVDLYLPVDAKVEVSLDQKVKGGITPIAILGKGKH